MKKILIVDDDPDIRESMKLILDTQYEVEEAESRQEALEIIPNFNPDLICMDVMMETLASGFDLARQIKKSGNPAKIIMITGVDKEVHLDFKSVTGEDAWLPVDAYLEKPLKPHILLKNIGKLI